MIQWFAQSQGVFALYPDNKGGPIAWVEFNPDAETELHQWKGSVSTRLGPVLMCYHSTPGGCKAILELLVLGQSVA